MVNGLTKMELKAIRRWLSKVFVGPSEQEEFMKVMERLDQLTKGKNDRQPNTRR
jgi:hypothetical protein